MHFFNFSGFDFDRAKYISYIVGITSVFFIFCLVYFADSSLVNSSFFNIFFWGGVSIVLLFGVCFLYLFILLIYLIKSRAFGSRLFLHLFLIFAALGLTPAILIYGVAYKFIASSINSWFDVNTEIALTSGLNLAKDALEREATQRAMELKSQSSQLRTDTGQDEFQKLCRLPYARLAVWRSENSSMRKVNDCGNDIKFESVPPNAADILEVKKQGYSVSYGGIGDVGLGPAYLHLYVPLPYSVRGITDTGTSNILEGLFPLSPIIVERANAVQKALQEYKERVLARDKIRLLYILTLTLSMAVAVLGTMFFAIWSTAKLGTPLFILAEGVSQVAAGDLTAKRIAPTNDELGYLTRAFSNMTQQLLTSRGLVEASVREVEASRGYLSSVLNNLSAGVFVLDARGNVILKNPAAERILSISEFKKEAERGTSLLEFFSFLMEQFSLYESRHEEGTAVWQAQYQLKLGEGNLGDMPRILMVRGAMMPAGERLVVCDDISDLASAQRAQAWSEVARRLAHEIKNPLTPIRLSAERLARRLAGKLSVADEAVVTKSVHTIVDQVDAMRRLVDEFRDFSRLPSANLVPLDLNALVDSVMALYTTESEKSEVVFNRAPSLPFIKGDSQQLRQVIHNLVQNALDSCRDVSGAQVFVSTDWISGVNKVRLSVKDSGTGFSEAMLKRIFEPYVTTKASGTGLGLAIVKKVADEHGARVEVSNRIQDGEVIGAHVSLSFDPLPGVDFPGSQLVA